MEDCDFNINIAVVGIGLIGGSYAMALRALNPKSIIGIDKDRKTLDYALHKGIIDRGYETGGRFLKEIDLVVIALYPKDTVEFVRNNIQNFKMKVLITDTSSVKRDVVNSIDAFLPDGMEFVSGHPMTGRESRGIEFASADIFIKANYIITPSNGNTSRGLKVIDIMARRIGCSNVTYVSPEEHDYAVAFTSQLPHAVAVSLMNSHEESSMDHIALFAGGSFRDATRVAQINSGLWSQLFIMNSDKLVNEIEKFQKTMDRLKTAIMYKNADTMNHIFQNAVRRRKILAKR
ncbi:prephenate dehydrogenase [Clostridium luticellarii]|uniref:Prephenate dehydrogenase n=1 Tax=Clostridium luticellarii TaxID=1691940 RepID=A0A2T0BG50_9CLOT|nr:prephenate dehydrogenase [Clostridium luticellarii]MCI1944861.1 prephenate dehydrogenase [Clostridium luticellarii]MCI1968323.1 prephenate dehydrogenase [Clostridium luticellarii]MCI1995321.1 prephenate dehydrogenase [Clostridium luticellarii]MCI2039417.1 prephenate dehydrogenase [Clostridium luticellarii]PRR82876.1 prephenate dehydrogenase [Clostridium luticellarii]